ncbi:hypothetical protein DMN91_004307 [Ooceraea biroi]|uniref:Uncharacterized protein n=1 Tax=Ooceraea biroi TaxID=2015173 RepID=A0A3L8DWE5_OOCBI|nr:hypothetical protein DMN91_004307 [Ooceraea biroi]
MTFKQRCNADNNVQESYKSSSADPSDTIPNELEPNSPEKAPRATITTISPHDNVVSSQTPTSLTHIPGDNSHLAETQTGNISKSLDPEVLEAIDKRLDDNTSKGEEAPAVISQDAKKPECSSSSNTVSPDGDEEAIEVFHPRSQVILPPEENFESTNEFILQETSLNHSVNTLSGRLKHFIPVWKELFSDKVVEWLEGYIIPFTDPLIQLREPAEPNWSKNERMLLADHIRQLLFKGAIQE